MFFCSTFVKVKRSVVQNEQGKKAELSPVVFLLQSEYSLCPEPELLIRTVFRISLLLIIMMTVSNVPNPIVRSPNS